MLSTQRRLQIANLNDAVELLQHGRPPGEAAAVRLLLLHQARRRKRSPSAIDRLLPAITIVIGAFRGPEGGFTLDNLVGLNTATIRNAYWVSIQVSFWSALLGCTIGFAMAAATVLGGLPRFIRGPLLTLGKRPAGGSLIPVGRC